MEYLAKLCANLLPSLLQWEYSNFEYKLENAMASWISGSTKVMALPPAFKNSMINSESPSRTAPHMRRYAVMILNERGLAKKKKKNSNREAFRAFALMLV